MRAAVVIGCVVVSSVAACSPQSHEGQQAVASPIALPHPLSAVQDESTPGIGATRAYWDNTHTPNAASDDGMSYGNDPSLPAYLAPTGATYGGVNDGGTGRIQVYDLSMLPVDGNEMLRRIRREMPRDATKAWDLTFDRCYRMAFNSPTLQAAGHYMAEVQLEYVEPDGSRMVSPDAYNHAWIWLDQAGAEPDRDAECSMWRS